jgi:hypothetical protein
MEFACRNLGQPPFGLMTPTKPIDLAGVLGVRTTGRFVARLYNRNILA